MKPPQATIEMPGGLGNTREGGVDGFGAGDAWDACAHCLILSHFVSPGVFDGFEHAGEGVEGTVRGMGCVHDANSLWGRELMVISSRCNRDAAWVVEMVWHKSTPIRVKADGRSVKIPQLNSSGV